MSAINVTVSDTGWSSLTDADAVCAESFTAARETMDAADRGHVSVLFGSDAEIADLNARLRGKEGPTNVLSFPAHESAQGWAGDIALAYGVTRAEAEAAGLALADHVRHLLVHGFLHLHGYDHRNDDEAEVMEAIERRALQMLGIADPYAARDGVA
ncbi:rRNA maturation RNase YbeY [Hyphobacterium marinum]|uniref:Endoribonuclease YbeY n=1 Tax=Hyphobacterium marinum TaxID=3116574 RepID=A0ABU7LVZ6_9PROT|nr:rRNA maturation RNase YbeY [Hyphobacterium sp. Y6023]MEE2565442.1 rRNA maturation RNase YbeY [Hyphobacterium sp. Y6023]